MKPANTKVRKSRQPRFRLAATAAIVVGVGLVALASIYRLNSASTASMPQGSGQTAGTDSVAAAYPFQVGDPGPGQMAPPIQLMSTTGSAFDLTSWRGKTVLLYFQEGISCQACWDQNRDIAHSFQAFRALGIDTIVTITTDPVDLLKQKAADTGLSTPVLSDPNLIASKAYHANDYGMMGKGQDGHTFIVVGPEGRIKWRADYGGAPNYTMYVPVNHLVADIRQGLGKAN